MSVGGEKGWKQKATSKEMDLMEGSMEPVAFVVRS